MNVPQARKRFKNNITDLYTVDRNGWKSVATQNDIEEKK